MRGESLPGGSGPSNTANTSEAPGVTPGGHWVRGGGGGHQAGQLEDATIEEVIGDAELPSEVAPDLLTGDGLADLSGLEFDIPLRVVAEECVEFL